MDVHIKGMRKMNNYTTNNLVILMLLTICFILYIEVEDKSFSQYCPQNSALQAPERRQNINKRSIVNLNKTVLFEEKGTTFSRAEK